MISLFARTDEDMAGHQRFRFLNGELRMEISKVLFARLSDKGLTPVEIKRFIKDFLNILQQGISDKNLINQKLRRLGWKSNILDETTYHLILL